MEYNLDKKLDLSAWNIFSALDLLCKKNATCSTDLRGFLAKQIWNKNDRKTILQSLSKLFLNLGCTCDIGSYFRPLILDVAQRTKISVLKDGHVNKRLQKKFAVALGLVLPLCPELERFTTEFIKRYRPLGYDLDEEPLRKKSKREKVGDLELCQAVFNITTHLRGASSLISVKLVANYLSHQDPHVKWFAALVHCTLIGMSEQNKSQFLQKIFSAQEMQALVHWHFQEKEVRESLINEGLQAVRLETLLSLQTHTQYQILSSDVDGSIISVTGVLLPAHAPPDKQTNVVDSTVHLHWVGVPSMMDNLRSLALAVSAGSPVLVQGPVGCGKTLLVQYLAALTGRHSAPHIIKVQLSDQTDSKALLGTYQCTEVPGQFVWRPGVLMEAVTKGYWVLLEDLDHAPMEVVSILAPLLQTSTLSVPGHGDLVRADPGFQLFATQRLFAFGDGLHSQNKNSAVLDKLWTQLTIQPLSKAELKEVVTTRFPNLSPIVNRLLEIYFMLSAGRHHLTSDPPDLEVDRLEEEEEGESTVGKFLSLTGRLVSTRDLMLWCCHVSERFVATSADNAELVFQAALDYFVSCLPSLSKRQALAEAIAAKLNLPQERAEYFLTKRKPMVDDRSEQFAVGDVLLPRKKLRGASALVSVQTATYSYTRPAACLLEKIAACVLRNEPVLLVGETGTGKTSSVQYLAQALGHKLHVINLNQQSDSVDLLGGFKPVDLKFLMMPLKEEFEDLFSKTFSQKQNLDFLRHLQNCFTQKRWHDLLVLMEHSYQGATKMANQKEQGENGTKWQKLGKKWRKLGIRLKQLKMQVQQLENVLAFSYMEGTLVKALKSGSWVLLDEINLAAAETLQCLVGLLESSDGSLVLTDRGIMEPVVRHPDFRLFACMNPATDVGKKDLTPGIRNRFTEFYVDELEEPEDLRTLVRDYLAHISPASWQLNGIVNFYLNIRRKAATDLVDGTGHRPHYSLRTLCRALKFVVSHNCGSKDRSLYEGFCLSFLTQLDRKSHPIVTQLICEHILDKSKKGKVAATLAGSLPCPRDGKYMQCCSYWISQGTLTPSNPDHYIITPFVKENLKDLARIVSAGSHPVLLQGETSVGKTSMITYLAQSSGNHCVRVNNHEHTDLQEYLGCYAADQSGKLIFREGVLVEAMRKGHWIILDELNLAPTDVLEALNRLLDDNQELFIPETQEVIKAHPKFMLFATQNPPGHYGGRKILSRAFRNRFVELHFDEIPKQELATILHQRCGIPESYAKRLVAVMADLQVQRQQTGLLAGKQSWMTLRDLFRWAERYHIPFLEDTAGKYYDFNQLMADQGYLLLAGRVRRAEEVSVIEAVIKNHFKNCRVGPDHLFNLDTHTSPTVLALLEFLVGNNRDRAQHLQDFSFAPAWVKGFEHVVWTRSMRRLAVLIGQAIQLHEPVLLVGDTGCGKTTLCQMFAAMEEKKLHSVGCHLHTESADFLGGLRPVRSHDSCSEHQKLFEWVDGPLVKSMKEGSMFLIDEISLADDSVLERLNSVLEPEKCILLAEKGGGLGLEDEVEVVKAAKGFQIFATMNPGGDFGKKELSPALRNRFTEIWCPQSDDRDDLVSIIDHNIQADLQLTERQNGPSEFGAAIMDFITWFSNNEIGKRCTVSIRNILTWVQFINVCSQDKTGRKEGGGLDPAVAFIHGACLVFLDSLGSGTTSRGVDFDSEAARSTCLQFLRKQVRQMTGSDMSLKQLGIVSSHRGEGCDLTVEITPEFLTIYPFSIPRECCSKYSMEQYAMQAPTTCFNAQRILRGLQLPRPLLLEGAPGVGKTSLVAAVARLAGRKLIRINLSEQTDVTDLFGADLPVEGGKGGMFAWRDGPFLQALKAGDWVVFDEMNLASQSVLEGLNACLDHRGEVFIPELGRTFHIQHDRTRIFACQNPLNQGGGRKGLPRSFLNRFTQVYVEPLTRGDLIFICCTMYPSFPQHLLAKMVDFNMKMYEETMVKCTWGRKGSPWEFNLRDISRWCDLLLANQSAEQLEPGQFVYLIYQERMRTAEDKQRVAELYCSVFGTPHVYRQSRTLRVTPTFVQAGQAFMRREGQVHGKGGGGSSGTLVLHHLLEPLESLITCVNMGWMSVLVGTSSSGKSSLVRLLSELCGHQLQVLPMSSDMDTTELLGGFEQMDIGRHITELTQEVVHEVRAFQQDCLIAEDVKSRGLLTSLDEQLVTITSSAPEDDEDGVWKEVEILTQRVQQLQSLVSKLSLLKPQSDRLTQLSAALNSELAALEKAQPGAGSVGGGAFEWVDSLFVKALCSGDWLLIDNVNFCSPSVLDRLNALLEPGGVLAINERGVMDGEVMTITPHPNFRLFLSMDQKNGEISRAMRNRGVEICILGEVEGCNFSAHDTLSMLHKAGLQSQAACDWLLGLNGQLRGQLGPGERPGLCDLLRVALMVRQQQEKGMELRNALRQAVTNVYVRNMRSLTARQLVCSVLSEEMKKLTAVDSNTLIAPVDCAVVALTADQYQFHSTLVSAKQAARALAVLLSPAYIHSFCPKAGTSVKDFTTSLHTALSIFVSHLDPACCGLAMDWVTNLVEKKTVALLSKFSLKDPIASERDVIKQQLTTSVGAAKTCLNELMGSRAWIKLQEAKQELCCGDSSVLEYLADQAWDLGYNPQLVDRVAIQMMKRPGQDFLLVSQRLATLASAVCRLQLLHELIAVRERMKDTLRDVIEQGQKVMRQKSDGATVLWNLCEVLMSVLDHLPDMVSHLTEEKLYLLHQKQDHLLWLPRMLEALRPLPQLLEATRARRNQSLEAEVEVCISQVALHWQWCWNKILSHLITPDSTQAVKASVSKVSEMLGDDNSAAKLFVKFWSSWGHPCAFLTETQAQLWKWFARLCSAIHFDRATSLEVAQPRVKFVVTSTGMSVRQQLLFVAQKLLSGVCDVESDLAHIEELLTLHNLVLVDSANKCKERKLHLTGLCSPQNQASSVASAGQHVQLWPVYENVGLRAELAYLLGQRAPGNDETRLLCLQQFMGFCSPPAHCFSVSPQQEPKPGEKMKWLLQVLQRLWNSPAAAACWQWLTWDCSTAALGTTPPGQDTDGPAVFHRSAVLYYASHLLSSSRSTENKLGASQYDLLPLNVTLGGLDTQLSLLDGMSQHLWTHAAFMSSPAHSFGHLELNLLSQTFQSMLEAVGCLVDVSKKEEWDSLLHTLNSTKSNSFSSSAISSCLLQVKALIADHCAWSAHSICRQHSLLDLISRCLGDMSEVAQDGSQRSEVIGKALISVGFTLLHLLSPRGPVDPVIKARVKLQHLREELSGIETDLQVWVTHIKLTTGLTIEQMSLPLRHPRLAFLLRRQDELAAAIAELEQRHAFREHSIQYSELSQAVTNFLSYLEQVDSKDALTVERLVDRLSSLLSCSLPQMNLKKAEEALSNEHNWQMECGRFTRKLISDFPCLVDLAVPVCLAVEEMRLGIRILAQDVMLRLQKKRLQVPSLLLPAVDHLEEVVCTLTTFPSVSPAAPTWHHLAAKLSCPATRELVVSLTKTCGDGDLTFLAQQMLSRLIESSLLFLKTHAMQTGEITPDLFVTLTQVLELLVSAWKEQEERCREKQEQEASLFVQKTKVRTHGETRSENEIEEEEYKTSFPMYHEDFADMVEAKRLEDTGKREPRVTEATAAALDVITDQEVDEVCQNHLHLLHRLTSASWMPRRLPFADPALMGWDILKPALLAYQVATAVGKHALDLLPATLDGKCLGAHLVVCATLAQCVQAPVSADGSASQLPGTLQPPTPRCYNIYLDSNVEEVMRCRLILQHVRDKVLSLLQSWPEHPTLRQLLQVVDRVETFPVTSPVMKFLFGMELLLEKAQQWESKAPSDSNISMAEQLSEVTELIMRWRTLELRCWRGALDIEVERSRKKTSRTWFHIYMVIAEQLHKGEINGEELVGTLKNYLEGAKACSLGEFSARLDILLAFHCQLVLTPPCEQREELLRILWNVHQYYKHFSPAVEAEIARCRKEKEEVLKGYTKTAGWGASWMNKNYWALKESTEKAHRKVHKAARAFQADLNKPVKEILLADKLSGSVSLEGPNQGGGGRYCEQVMACHARALEQIRSLEAAQLFQSDSSLEGVLGKLQECPLLLKLPSRCRKMVKHWQTLVSLSHTCRNITLLDELTGDLLEEAQELQKLEVPQVSDGDKKKLKAEIKHIGLRKRKALADCFKQLTSIGLSYRKGLIKEKTSLGNTVWKLAPLNPAACLDKESHLVGLWEGCEVYFAKCLVRLDRFSEAMYSPSRELGADNVQRCQGFVSHLAALYIQQRRELTDTFNYFLLYRKLLSAIDRLRSDTRLPPQTETRQHLGCVKATVTQVCQGLLQFTVLLSACPPPASSGTASPPSPLPPSDLPPMSHLRRGNELWTRCFTLLQTYCETAQNLQAKLLGLSENCIFTHVDLEVLSGSVAELSLVGDGLQELVRNLDGDTICLASSLAYLGTVIKDTCASFTCWRQALPETMQAVPETMQVLPETMQAAAAVDSENLLRRKDWLIGSEIALFAAKLESYVKAVLLSIQDSVKDGETVDKKAVHLEGSLDLKEQDGNELKENHLMLLYQELHKNLDFLRTEKQAKHLEEVVDELKDMTEGNVDGGSRSALCARLVIHCLPVLRVYGEMLEDHVGKALALHRTLGKMLAVMLAVFTQLALKGFCLPAEFGEEDAGEGASDFVNIESGGIGEGEGAKDVSDQIESEDQLDEARRPGDEKEEEEQKENIAPEKNAIEMSEDFEADPQDMEPVEGDNDNSDDNDSNEANEDDLDKQMGDVDGPGSEQLDDQMWGSDEEDDSKDQQEEDGPGSGPQGEKELRPQEDLASSTKDDQKRDDVDKGADKEGEDDIDDEQEHETPDLPQFDESEYDDNHLDPQHGDSPEQKEAENLDLPEDLNLDKDEKGEEEDSSEKPPAEEEAAGEVPDVTGKEDEGQEEKNEDGEQGEDKEGGASEEEKDKDEDDVQEENMKTDATEDKADGDNEDDGRKEAKQDNQTDEDENKEESTKGFNAQESSQPETDDKEEMEEPEERGKSSSEAVGAVQSEEKQDRAVGDDSQEEKEGVGAATSEQEEGHEGSMSTQVTEGSAPRDRTQSQRRPGQSREDRCLGSAEEKFKRLKTIDSTSLKDESRHGQEKQEAELYEHVREENAHADAQTLDVATDQQQKDQDVVGEPVEEGGEEANPDEDVQMADNIQHTEDLNQEKKPKDAGKEKPAESGPEDQGQENREAEKMEIEGDVVLTHGAERPPDSTIHTQLEHLHLGASMTDVDVLRGQLEAGMNIWSLACSSDIEGIAVAMDAWQKYETLTSSLSQELCEQLRLVLEPSQSTKLRGDYRTGKRLNMRKVIPYIASQFRKDKIWLRRTKPSKRQYQIMLAIDDSSSMADNHSKQMAFESLALIANALTLLETGDLAVCSFGETVKLLHPFTEPFSTQAGACILHSFTFQQTQTDVALLLQQATAAMVEAQSRQQSFMGRPETAQLLVIVSDGRGINAKGASVVKRAVRQAREANIFLVFVILDDPKNKNSILDIRIPIFTTGGDLKMRSYMEEFPFPFYVILRDINSLPQVLSDALRQWFELVTTSA